jgi:hypothetical protein
MPLALMVGWCPSHLAEGQGKRPRFHHAVSTLLARHRADMHFGRPKMRLVAIPWRLDGHLHKVSTSKHTFNHRKEAK